MSLHKKITGGLIVLVLSLTVGVASVLALDNSALKSQAASRAAQREQRQADQLSRLKDKAAAEIDRRLVTLNNLLNRINSIQKIASSDKSSIVTELQNEINALTALKTKIAGDTDLAALRVDVKSIVSEYRVYALVMPKEGLVVAADMVLKHVDRYSELYNKLSQALKKVQDSGQNVASLQTALNDMQVKLADAKQKADNAKAAALALTPQQYPANRTTMQSVKTNLQQARQDLQAARSDARTILEGLKAFRKTTTSSSAATPRI